MTAALHGLCVWITRPTEGAGRSADQWTARGAEVLLAPVLELEDVEPGASVRAALADCASADTVVALTSANAARHFARGVGVRAADGEPWHCVAVGGRTADLARAAGLRIVHVAARATAADLAGEMITHLRPRRVLFPGSDRRRDDLPRHLRDAGIEVLDFTLYRNRPHTDWGEALTTRLRAGRIDLVAVYSPSAVEAVAKGWPRGGAEIGDVAFASLGPTTAEAVLALGLTLVASPEDPGETALLGAVEEWWSRETRT